MTLVRRMSAYNSGEEIILARMVGPEMDIHIQIKENMKQLREE